MLKMTFKNFHKNLILATSILIIILLIIHENSVLGYLDQSYGEPPYSHCPSNNFTVNDTLIVPIELSLCTKPIVSYSGYQNYDDHHYGYSYTPPPMTSLTCQAEKQPCGCNPDLCEEWDEPDEIKIYDATCVSCFFCLCYAMQDGSPVSTNCVEVTGVLSPPLYRECSDYCRSGCEGPYAPIRQQVPEFCTDVDEKLRKSSAKHNNIYFGPFSFMCKDTRGDRGPNSIGESNDYRNCVCSVLINE